MLSLVTPLIKDPDDSVRNNAVFALGEIAFYGKESIYKLVFKFVGLTVVFKLNKII